MSASNWEICPKCFWRAQNDQQSRIEGAKAAYGVVAPEEYLRLMSEASAPLNAEEFRTFREDYEFYGAHRGEIVASYSGHCEKCGCGVDFEECRRFFDPATEAGGA